MNKKIVELNLNLFIMQNDLIAKHIAKENNCKGKEPQKNDTKHYITFIGDKEPTRTYSFRDAIMKARGLDN